LEIRKELQPEPPDQSIEEELEKIAKVEKR